MWQPPVPQSPTHSPLTRCRTHFRGLSEEGAGGGLRRRCSHSLWFPLDVSLCLVISSCGVFVVHSTTPCEKVGGRRLCLRRFIKISKNFGGEGWGSVTGQNHSQATQSTKHHPAPPTTQRARPVTSATMRLPRAIVYEYIAN